MFDVSVDDYLSQARVWVLSDGKPGHLNQSLGVCEALGLEPEIIPLEKRRLGTVLGFLYPPLRVKTRLSAPYPDVVIAAGNLTVDVAKHIKMKHRDAFLVQMMRPQGSLGAFSVLAIPAHNRPKMRDNVVVTLGAPNRVTVTRLAEAAQQWQSLKSSREGVRHVALLVGGSSKKYRFTEADALRLAALLHAHYPAETTKLLITTSRRTGALVEQVLLEALAAYEKHLYTGKGENPYFGYLALADELVATVDSVSMVSEACSTAKPVRVFDVESAQRMGKFRIFYENLLKRGRISSLKEPQTPLDVTPLQDALTVASFIRARLLKRLLAETLNED